MSENPNTPVELHALENNRAPSRHRQRLQRVRDNLQYVITIVAAIIFIIVVLKNLFSGSQEDAEKLPAVLKQLSNIAFAAVHEKAPWQNQTTLNQS